MTPEQASQHTRRMARHVSTVAGATLVSRVLGFVRDATVAAVLGAGWKADAFYAAFRIPNLLRRLFGEGSLTMAFVPAFARLRREQGRDTAFAMARAAMLWTVVILGLATVLAVVFARPLALALAPGFSDDPGRLGLTATLVRICFPYVMFIGGLALCMGVLNGMDRFLGPALAPSILNLVLITTALLSLLLGWDAALALAWGLLAAGLLQVLLQQPFLRGIGFTWRGPVRAGLSTAKAVGARLGPTVFGASVFQITVLLAALLASFLPTGGISCLYYADRLVQLPLGLFGVAVGTAALPGLSALVAAGKEREFEQTLVDAIRLTLFVSLPAAFGLAALSGPVVGLLFERGAFSAQATTTTAQALMAYCLGLPAFAVTRPLVAACYARDNIKTPTRAALLCVILFPLLGYSLMRVLAHTGLAMAVSLVCWLNALLLAWPLLGRSGRWRDVLIFLPGPGLLGLGVGLGAWALAGLPDCPRWLAVAQTLPWAVAYLAVARSLGIREAGLLVSMFTRGRGAARNKRS